MNRPNPTLIDVAHAAGVSRSTASNVFAHPDRVRPEMRQRVETAARALGYAGPDPRGRLLRSGKVHAVGVWAMSEFGVADALRNPVYLQFLQGVGDVCDAEGVNMMIFSDRTRSGLDSAVVDGFILNRVEQLAELESVRLRRLPLVVVDFDAGPELNSVRVDSRVGCLRAAQHLLALGHRRFAVLSFLRAFGPPRYYPPGRPRPADAAGMPTDQEKLAGYAEALGEAGIAIDMVPIVQAHAWDAAAAAMLLDLAPEATAILSMSVMQGLAIVAEAQRRGCEVPRDLSVVAFNDIPAAAAAVPGLTTVDGRTAEKGRIAARIIFEAGPPRHEVLSTDLILRGTTARPRTD